MIKVTWTELERTYLLTLDATTSEQFDFVAAVSRHPIERGSPRTDHVRPEPITLTVEGVVTDTPLFLPPDHTDGMVTANHQVEAPAQTLADAIERKKFTPGLGQSGFAAQAAAIAARNIKLPAKRGYVVTNVGNRQRLITDTLKRLRDKAIVCSCETKLARFDNLVLASSTVRRAPGQQMTVTMTLQEVLGAQVAALEPVSQVSTGRKQKPRTQPEEEEAPVPQSSAAYRMGAAIGRLF